MKTFKKALELFLVFFKIGLFTFGGGYAMISVISHEVVEKRKYIDADEFSDVVAIAESTPGPIAINSATYIGYRVAGVLGSLMASLGVVLPSLLIIFVISLFFDKFLEIELVKKAFRGIQCAVAVLIVSAAFKLLKSVEKNVVSVILIIVGALGLLAIDFFSINISTIYFVLLGALVGIAVYYRPKKKPTSDQKTGDNGTIAPLIDDKEGDNK